MTHYSVILSISDICEEFDDCKHIFLFFFSDIDECENNTLGCVYQCHNTQGEAYCSCPAGFKVAKDGKTCAGIKLVYIKYTQFCNKCFQ